MTGKDELTKEDKNMISFITGQKQENIKSFRYKSVELALKVSEEINKLPTLIDKEQQTVVAIASLLVNFSPNNYRYELLGRVGVLLSKSPPEKIMEQIRAFKKQTK